jgi:hypothetical protein
VVVAVVVFMVVAVWVALVVLMVVAAVALVDLPVLHLRLVVMV